MLDRLLLQIRPVTENRHSTGTDRSCRHAKNQCSKGPSIKYVTLFLANFDLPSPCHTSSHIPGRDPYPKSTSHISDPPRFLVGLVQKIRTKALCPNSLSIVREGFCPGASVRGSFVWKILSGVVFVRTPFCQNTSVTTESQKSL